ncbi:MAG: hypothetical protein M1300_10830 [Epsilonproteobacteria bacterium]|nr:hypothetical protein [Campylobacterota bacterium]
MNKKTIKKYSNNKLRHLAVIMAAYDILHMEETFYFEKTFKDEDSNSDLTKESEFKIERAVARLEKIALGILQPNKIHPSDRAFFVSKSGEISDAFFETGIIKRGVVPQVAFATLLFSYFAEVTNKKVEAEFDALKEVSLYDSIFDPLEEGVLINWWDHYHNSLNALSKGVGLSLSYKLPAPKGLAPLLKSKSKNQTHSFALKSA